MLIWNVSLTLSLYICSILRNGIPIIPRMTNAITQTMQYLQMKKQSIQFEVTINTKIEDFSTIFFS